MPWFLENNDWLVYNTLITAFIAIAAVEVLIPRRSETPALKFRWINNLGLMVISITTESLLRLVPAASAAWLANHYEFGLFQYWDSHWVVIVITLLLMLSLVDYLVHRLMHAVPWLWRLHMVHHSDTDFDVSVTYRTHPLAALFISFCRWPAILLLGAPVGVLILYEAILIFMDLFSHANIRIPKAIERRLRYVIITPDFHRIHHSSEKHFTNSNYSSIFPLWDYLFGTARHRPYREHATFEIGLEYFRDLRDSRLDRLLLMPFHGIRFKSLFERKPDEESVR